MVEHDCSQEPILATICEKLVNIEKAIREIKNLQKEYMDEQKEQREQLNKADIERAKYPSPETVNGYLKKVDAHDIYFAILSVIMGILIALLVAVGSGALQKLLGVD